MPDVRAMEVDAVIDEEPDVLLFDGVCNLCAWAVRFVSARDAQGTIHYASLQSDLGRRLLVKHHLDATQMDTFVFVEQGKAFVRSTAALRVARRLTGLWPLFYGAIILPAFLRDPVYRWISHNRYRWFGKSDTCMMPTPELRARMLS